VVGSGRLRAAAGFAVRATVLALLLLFSGGIAASRADQPQSAPAASPPATPAAPATEAPPATVVVFGDSQAQGLAGGLQRILLEDPRYHVVNRTHPGAALVHGENEWLRPIEQFTSHDKANIAIVMFGANDRLDLRGDDGAYLHFRSDEWRAAYAERADKILALLAAAGLKIVWCGNPIARSETYSNDMSYINDIYAAEVAKFGGQFVSLWTVVADDQGHYSAYGKDREGTTERLRADDGIHFTAPGYELIAEKIVGLLTSAAANAR